MPRIHCRLVVPAWVGWLTGLCWAVSVQAQEPPAQSQNQASQVTQRSASHAGSGEVGLAGEFPDRYRALDLEDGGQVPALYFAAQTVPAKGGIVLLSDAGQGAASDFSRAVARRLADTGWAVVSLGLEAPSSGLDRLLEQPVIPSDGGAPQNKGGSSVMIDVMQSKSPEDAVAAYRKRVLQTLTAGIKFASDEGFGQPSLIGVGHAAGHVLEKILSQTGLPALIWVAPAFYPPDAARLPETLAGAGSLSVLELSPDDRMERARRRSVSIRKAGFVNYSLQPVPLSVPPGEPSAHAVANRVLAWLAKTVQ